MNPLQVIVLFITKIIGKFFNPESHVLGDQLFNKTVYLEIPMGSSAEATLKNPGYDMWINQIKCELKYGGNMIYYSQANRDEVKLTIKDTNGGNAFSDQSLDVGTIDAIGQNQNFEGFMVPAAMSLIFTAEHTSQNWTTAASKLYLKIVLSGKRLDSKTFENIKLTN
jgi:hypothetical protein